MPYVQIEDIRKGMDRSKVSRVNSELGSAWTIKNGHLTRGGDIERRKSFVKISVDFPSTTKGLFSINDTLYTVGYDASQAGNVPVGVNHILTQHPTPATAITRVLDAEAFDGRLYSISQFSDGNIYHFYETTRVIDWDNLSATIGSNDAIAAALEAAIDNSAVVSASVSTNVVTITADVAGTPFTISAQTVNNGVSPQTEVLASGTVQITGGTSSPGVNKINSITVNGVNILGAAVDWTTSNDNTAALLKTQIDAHTSSPEYTTSVVGSTLTITALTGTGDSPNGFVVVCNVGGNVTSTVSNMAGGVDQVDSETLTLNETQPNVPGVTEVVSRAVVEVTGGTSSAGINTISSITIDGVEILDTAVDWTTSNSNTASLLKTQIDSYTSSPEYDTEVSGPFLTIKAKAGTGASPNGFVVVVTVTGDVTVDADTVMSGGVTAVTAIAQVVTATVGGTFEEADQFIITINGTEIYTVTGAASGTGTTVQTFKKKLYTVASSNLYFSALNAPTQWTSGIDPGFINMASETSGAELLTATAEYQGLMAVFSKNNIRIWSISEDSSENVFLQALQNTGTIAPNSVISYGNNDVFYLANTGIRSIKARDSSNSAFVSDVGTAIDTHVRDFLNTLTEAQQEAAVAIIEPLDGRYWIAVYNRIYVFSFFPSKKISAWSYYDLDITITHFARVNNRIYCRATKDGVDGLYLYGGVNNDSYPAVNVDPVLIELPFISAKNPASSKILTGFDILASNNWKVEILPDPNDLTVKTNQGIASKITYGTPRFAVPGEGSLFGINLTCSAAGPATLSALALHYNQS